MEHGPGSAGRIGLSSRPHHRNPRRGQGVARFDHPSPSSRRGPPAEVDRVPLVAAMIQQRYLERTEEGVTLGLRLFELGARASVPRRLIAAAAPRHQEPAGPHGRAGGALGSSGHRHGVDRGRAGRLPMLSTRAGMRSPALTTASGKAYLAFCADQSVVDRVSAPLIDDAADQFRDELSQVRASVVATDREVSYPGILAVASPVLSADHVVLGAISIAGPSGAMDPERVAPLVRAAGATLSSSAHGGIAIMRTADWTESVSVLDRVTAVFEAFGEHDEGLGVSELARRANLPKSTVSRIAADLVGQRFLDRDGDKLYLGIRLFELGQTVERPRRASRARTARHDRSAQPDRPHRSSRRPGGSGRRLHRDRPWPARTEATRRRVGGRLPAHATALGKAILASSAPRTSSSPSRTAGSSGARRTRSASRRRCCASWPRPTGAGPPPSGRNARPAAPASRAPSWVAEPFRSRPSPWPGRSSELCPIGSLPRFAPQPGR